MLNSQLFNKLFVSIYLRQVVYEQNILLYDTEIVGLMVSIIQFITFRKHYQLIIVHVQPKLSQSKGAMYVVNFIQDLTSLGMLTMQNR